MLPLGLYFMNIFFDIYYCYTLYRGADKSIAAPEKKKANVSARMAWISFGALPCKEKKKLDDSSRLDLIEIVLVPDILPGLFPSWSSLGHISTPVCM